MTEAMAIRVRETGGVENMRAEKITLPPPGAGEALVRNRAVGVNFIDVYHRSGLYPGGDAVCFGDGGRGRCGGSGRRRRRVAAGGRESAIASAEWGLMPTVG